MDLEKKLEDALKRYQELGQKNSQVNAQTLMMNALQNRKANLVSPRAKKWAYLVSVGLPPFGLFCALRYFFGDEDDAKQAAFVCALLTVISVVGLWLFGKILFSGSGATFEQIQQINPNDLRQLTE